MALHHAAPNEIVDLFPSGETTERTGTVALVKTDAFEAIRLVLESGTELPTHHVTGPITLQCLTGNVRLSLPDGEMALSAGQWVYLEGGAPHAVRALEHSTLLLTILFERGRAAG